VELIEVPRRKVLWLEVGAMFALADLGLLAQYMLYGRGTYFAEFSSPRYNVQLLFTTLGILLPLVFVLWISGDRWSFFGLSRLRFNDCVWIRVLLALGFLSSMLYAAPINSPELAELGDWYSRPITPTSKITALATLSVTAVWEEVYYRGYLVTRLEELTKNVWMGVVVSSMLFAAGHIYQGPRGVLFTLGFGLLYGIAFVHRRSVWPLAIAHWLTNVVIVMLIP